MPTAYAESAMRKTFIGKSLRELSNIKSCVMSGYLSGEIGTRRGWCQMLSTLKTKSLV